MAMTVNIAGQVGQTKLSPAKALWPLFKTVINSIQSFEDMLSHKLLLLDLRNDSRKAISARRPSQASGHRIALRRGDVVMAAYTYTYTYTYTYCNLHGL